MRAWVFALAAGAAVAPGCYCSHSVEHGDASGSSDADVDASMTPASDGDVLDTIDGDAGVFVPSCIVECAPAELVVQRTLTGSYDYTDAIMDVGVSDGAVWILLRRGVSPPATELEEVYALYRTDLAAATLTTQTPPPGMRTHPPLSAANLRADGDAFRTVALTTSLNTYRPRDANVATATWSTTGTFAMQTDPLATAPFMLTPTTASHAAVFGRDARDYAAFAEGMVVHAFIVDRASTTVPPLVDLVDLSDSGALAPLSGAVLADGRIVIAGGGAIVGWSGLTEPQRAPFYAVGDPSTAPLIARPVVGQPYDPTPLVVAEGAGFALARAATDATDVGASALHVQHFGADGSLASEVVIPTLGGLSPTQTNLFAAGDRAGLAWTEHVYDSATAVELRLVAPSLDDGCDSLAANAVTRLDTSLVSLFAVAGTDGAAYVATLTTDYPMTSLAVYRVPTCHVTRR